MVRIEEFHKERESDQIGFEPTERPNLDALTFCQFASSGYDRLAQEY